jgi:glycosyltransferase involved in cell wall biosynthesis
VHICHVTWSGFSYPYFAALVTDQALAGNRLTLITFDASPAPEWADGLESVEHLALGRQRKRRLPGAAAQLTRIFRRQTPDVVVTHLFWSSLAGLVAAVLSRVPIRVLVRHHLDQHHLMRRRFHASLDGISTRLAHQIVVPSEAVARHLQDVEHASRPISVIPHGFARERFGAHAPAPPEGDPVTIAFVGRIEQAKGVFDLLDTAELLRRSAPLPFRILLVGELVDESARTEVDRRGLEEIVEIRGYCSDVPKLLSSVEILVHPSHSESFSQVVMEGLAAGCAVVATAVGGIPELISHGRTGMLVPPHNPERLASALREVIADPALRRRLAEAGREHANASLTYDQMLRRYRDLAEHWAGALPTRA